MLSQGRQLPTPQAQDIFTRYDEWLNRPKPEGEVSKEEPSFDIFVRDMPDADRLLKEIGFCENDPEDGLLRAFKVVIDTRKAIVYHGMSPYGFRLKMWKLPQDKDTDIDAGILQIARASGANVALKQETHFGRDAVRIRLEDAPNALYLHKHEHSDPLVMPVAYTIECRLQEAEIPYTVRYNRVLFRYNPEDKKYEKIEAPVVDYFEELHPDAPPMDEHWLDDANE